MANAFKTFTDTAVGTANADVYTCPASTETTIIGLNVANILAVSITVSVQLINNDGDNVHIVKDAIVPVGSTCIAPLMTRFLFELKTSSAMSAVLILVSVPNKFARLRALLIAYSGFTGHTTVSRD